LHGPRRVNAKDRRTFPGNSLGPVGVLEIARIYFLLPVDFVLDGPVERRSLGVILGIHGLRPGETLLHRYDGGGRAWVPGQSGRRECDEANEESEKEFHG